MTARAFRVHAFDNVATLLDDADPGPIRILGEGAFTVEGREKVVLGHKIAVVDIPRGGAIFKFGVHIGHAIKAIRFGEWVHLHNSASDYDARSQTLLAVLRALNFVNSAVMTFGHVAHGKCAGFAKALQVPSSQPQVDFNHNMLHRPG